MSLAIATRYANALADVVLGSKGALQPQTVSDQLRTLESLTRGSADLRNVLASPAVAMAKKGAVLTRLCESIGMDRLLRNFVYIVIRNRRGNLFPQIRWAFERALDDRTGVMKAEVSSAAELGADVKASLEAELARMSGRRIRCQYSVNPALLGGAVAKIGSTVYDGSVRGQLQALHAKLTS